MKADWSDESRGRGGDVLGSEGSEVLHCSPSFFHASTECFHRLASQDYIRIHRTSKCGECMWTPHTEWTKRYLDILEIAAQDQRQDAKNKIVRSLGEHFHHQQECYENIILWHGNQTQWQLSDFLNDMSNLKKDTELNWSTVFEYYLNG